MLYRKKPHVHEAREYTGENTAELAEWCGGRPCAGGIFIETLHGEHLARPGDFIVKARWDTLIAPTFEPEFWPVKPHVFHATYELVGELDELPTLS